MNGYQEEYESAMEMDAQFESEQLQLAKQAEFENNRFCHNCGSEEIIAWGPDQDKCTKCELTWNV